MPQASKLKPTANGREQPPLLSIITINKNNANGVLRSVSSFQPLTGDPRIEFIFIDGNSSDKSLAHARQFYEERKIVSGADNGIYAAMNHGFRLSTGKWLLWINSGDEFLSSSWPKLSSILTISGSSLICGAAEIVDPTVLGRKIVKEAKSSNLPWQMVNHSSSVFSRSAFLASQMYDETYKIAADRRLIVDMHQKGAPIEFIDLCISRFWLGGISDKQKFLRSRENLRVDLELSLITVTKYWLALGSYAAFFFVTRPLILLIRNFAKTLGIELPSLGRYAGPFGELKRESLSRKLS